MPNFYTPEEVAAMFRVKKSTVLGWHRSGKLPGFKLPGSCLIRFTQAAVDTFTSNTTEATA